MEGCFQCYTFAPCRVRSVRVTSPSPHRICSSRMSSLLGWVTLLWSTPLGLPRLFKRWISLIARLGALSKQSIYSLDILTYPVSFDPLFHWDRNPFLLPGLFLPWDTGEEAAKSIDLLIDRNARGELERADLNFLGHCEILLKADLASTSSIVNFCVPVFRE